MTDDLQMTSATWLARHLRPSWAVKGEPRPQPVVVLLGPVGSGKTHTLDLMDTDCGDSVVHARFDFDDDLPIDTTSSRTVEALAQVAKDLSRKWPARGTARFPRFTLGLIAAQAILDQDDPASAKDVLRTRINDFTRDPAVERDLIPEAAATALPRLIRVVGRRPLSKVRPGQADFPEAQQNTFLDALVSLNEQVTVNPASMTAWLTSAFLADVRDNHPRLATPDPRSPCVCGGRDNPRHWHNWVLLLDNIDRWAGRQFLKDLQDARERQLRSRSGDHDALLVIATSGRWNYDWEQEWRPPWRPEPDTPDRERTIVRCGDAGYDHWRGESRQDPPPRQYPVLLEPLSVDEIARVLRVSRADQKCAFALRATEGLPVAVDLLEPLVRGREITPGARDVLSPRGDPGGPGEEALWLGWLDRIRLTRHLKGTTITDFVTAAPYATAPWLMPDDAKAFLPRNQTGRIISELRTALWITAPEGSRGTDRTRLHPWVARTLTQALAARPNDADGYNSRFSALLSELPEDPETAGNQVRRVYCELALERFTGVVEFFKNSFDTEPNRRWLAQLDMVTSAPDKMPLDMDRAALLERLLNERNRRQQDGRHASQPDDRPEIGNLVARLVAAKWLAANPFAVPYRQQRNIIANAYRGLSPLSNQHDAVALDEAARHADETDL